MREATRGPREGPVETNVKAIELRDLWRRYKSSGDERARERLVVAYSPLVKYVSGRMASGLPAHVDEADLISYGLSGLINQIERANQKLEGELQRAPTDEEMAAELGMEITEFQEALLQISNSSIAALDE